MNKTTRDPASFRDPAGYVFTYHHRILRAILSPGKKDYDLFMSCGLYARLTELGLLVNHREVTLSSRESDTYKILEPEKIPFISYPYEWCFDQLKDAALLTLRIQEIALSYGMSLKDASSFNIQFLQGKPILIDSLSFERYIPGKPWVAYKQFCEQFLAPLAIMQYSDPRLTKLMQEIGGEIPLSLAPQLLPWRARLHFGLLVHIYLHGWSQTQFAEQSLSTTQKETSMSRDAVSGIVASLSSTIQHLHLPTGRTLWSDYYVPASHQCSYHAKSFQHKQTLVRRYLRRIAPKSIWDIGANTGIFSQIASSMGIMTIALDNDHGAIEHNYLQVKEQRNLYLLPLWIDVTHPTPALGWHETERMSLSGRPHPEAIMALAVIHHLAIANNLPFTRIAEYFASLTSNLIIEFVPKNDPQVQFLLSRRTDIFPTYTKNDFEVAFREYFTIREQHHITHSPRILYLMERRKQ